MRAIILAAGRGLRLQQAEADHVPKVLLKFGGKTLLERHLLLLKACGVDEIVLALGFRHRLVEEELDRLGWLPRADVIVNPRFTEGSLLTVAIASEHMTRGGEVLLMDGDVLYDARMPRALLKGGLNMNRLLIDRDFEGGDEPVKVCLRGGVPVEFRKRIPPDLEFDLIGESVGFFRLTESAARKLAEIVRNYVDDDQGNLPHEEALRDLLLAGEQHFDICDVTGVPWIEIDFPGDVIRAQTHILTQLEPL
jgi:choline kinase